MAVPKDISIISLEDDPRYYPMGITYCGPDFERIGYQMAHTIIGDIPVAKTTLGFVRTSAIVMERLSTR